MKTSISFLVILICLVVVNSLQLCGNSAGINANTNYMKQQQADFKMKTGSFGLVPSSEDRRYSYYNISSDFNNTIKWPYDVALSLIYIENYYDPDSIEFHIRSTVSPSYFTALLIMSETSKWTSAHIHYIISAREDLRVGMFTSSPSELLKNSEIPSRITISHTLQNPWMLQEKLIWTNFFLSGITTKDTFINVDILMQTTKFDQDIISCQLEISEQQKPIELLTFSYVVFTGFESSLSVTAISDPVSEIHSYIRFLETHQEEKQVFLGMTQINAQQVRSNFEANKRRMLAQQQILLAASPRISSFQKSFNIHGLQFINEAVFASLNNLIEDGLSMISKGKQCLTVNGCKSLGGNTIFQAKEGRSCIVCRKNQFFNPEKQNCECLNNYVKDKAGNCVQQSTMCPNQQVYLQGSCFKLIQTEFVSGCGLNKIYDKQTHTCICKPGFYESIQQFSIKKCIKECSHNHFYDLLTETCIQCSVNAVYDPKAKTCECKQGYNGINCLHRKTKLKNIPIF